jgi:exopolyphosphatase/guanosine-5'-triphosphate,3'-diphosphate pyrophosphatase
MAPVGVLDLGTNTFRLLVARLEHPHRLHRELTERRIVRIGEGFSLRKRISHTACERSLKVLEEFAVLMKDRRPSPIQGVATGVFREAENGPAILQRLASAVPFPLRIISAEEEGAYTVKGVRAGLDLQRNSDILIVDIGGGSTEFVRIGPDGKRRIESIPVGVVYLRDRFEDWRISEGDALSRVEHWIDRSMAVLRCLDELPEQGICVGTGGTVTTLAYMDQGLKRYNPSRIQGAVLTEEGVGRLSGIAAGSTPDALALRYHLEKGKADLVYLGSLFLRHILKRVPGHALMVSDYGILEGVALEMLEAHKSPL